MRKIFVALAIVSTLTACSTAQVQPVAVAPMQPVVVSPTQNALDQMPTWFTEVPKTEGVIHAVGDGVSGSLSGALGNARANAFEGICQAAGGTVRSQTKIYRQDTEASSTSMSTTAIRNLCPDVDVTGAVVEKRKIIQEGNRFRAYVLVGLPMGEKNTLARQKQIDKVSERAAGNADKEFKELDRLVDKTPVSDAGTSKEGITLMNVDNAEYKAKRDIALQKEGAVIGQTTVR